MNKLAPYWKAIVGFVAPGTVVIATAINDASQGGSTITQTEWVTALLAMVITGGGVYAKSNTDPKGTHQDESVQPVD